MLVAKLVVTILSVSSVSCSGAKLDDFADFTTFGIATSLLLRTPDLMDNVLCMFYVLSVFVRLCFFSSGTVSSRNVPNSLLSLFALIFLRIDST